jgi:ferredoxin--NADP+ reductase
MAQQWVSGEVCGKVAWTGGLYSLRVKAPIEPFEAGQFIKLALEVDGQVVGRPYSLVSPPGEQPLDFYFITVEGGPLSARLAALEPGQAVLVAPRASGFLTLAEMPEGRDLWLLSTGTGVGPFLSILRTEAPWRRFERVVLVHAVRTAAELAYGDLIRSVEAARGDRFAFVSFVSREPTQFALAGRIPAALADGRLEARTGIALDPAHSRVMLCGNPAMVDDAQAVLQARGFRKHRRREPGHILVETYW